MTVHQNSRYRFRDSYQTTTIGSDSVRIHKIRKTTVSPQNGFRIYVVRAGDTFESLAYTNYGDARKWYVIADANYNIFFPLDLEPGSSILIPPKTFAIAS
jgi:nucleoid-associated protein YgaU